MYTKMQKKGTVRFAIRPGGEAKKVELAGCFSGWKPLPMQPQKDGTFVKVMPLPAGTYEYKFIVDGQWRGDPDHSNWAMNPFGTLNSVAQI